MLQLSADDGFSEDHRVKYRAIRACVGAPIGFQLSEARPFCVRATESDAIDKARRDITRRYAGFALRHSLFGRARRIPPRRALRCARQIVVDDLFDLREAQHEFDLRLLFQIVPQRIKVRHRVTSRDTSSSPRASLRVDRDAPSRTRYWRAGSPRASRSHGARRRIRGRGRLVISTGQSWRR